MGSCNGKAKVSPGSMRVIISCRASKLPAARAVSAELSLWVTVRVMVRGRVQIRVWNYGYIGLLEG